MGKHPTNAVFSRERFTVVTGIHGLVTAAVLIRSAVYTEFNNHGTLKSFRGKLGISRKSAANVRLLLQFSL